MPSIGYYCNFGIIDSLEIIDEAVEFFTEFNETPLVSLKEAKSAAGSKIKFLGIAVISTGIAELAVSVGRKSELVGLGTETSCAGSASMASMRN